MRRPHKETGQVIAFYDPYLSNIHLLPNEYWTSNELVSCSNESAGFDKLWLNDPIFYADGTTVYFVYLGT